MLDQGRGQPAEVVTGGLAEVRPLVLGVGGQGEDRQFDLARNPLADDLIPARAAFASSAGAWKGEGKRGGARVIYFHHDAGMPLFALTAFAKNEQADLSQQDRNDFRQLTTLLVKIFKRRKP